jgi:hypothetical protein
LSESELKREDFEAALNAGPLMKFKLNMKVLAHKRHTKCLQDKAAFDVTLVLVIHMRLWVS